MAAAVDHLAVANWMTATLNRDEEAEPLEYPEPVPRPGLEAEAGDAPDEGDDDGPSPTDVPASVPVRGPSPAELAGFFG